MTMATIHDLHRSSRARMGEREAQDAARAHLEQCRSLDDRDGEPGIVAEWRDELSSERFASLSIKMLNRYGDIRAMGVIVDAASFFADFWRTAYLDSAECETLIDDMAADAKEWPR